MIFSPCKKCLVRAACSQLCYKFIERLSKNKEILKKIEKGAQIIYRSLLTIFIISFLLVGIWGSFITCTR